LQGQGVGTVLLNMSDTYGTAAILLVGSSTSPTRNVGAGVTDLALYSSKTAGIRADSRLTGGVVDLRLSDLQVSSRGAAFDLAGAPIYHARIHRINVNTPGSSALLLGDAGGYSVDNQVVCFQVSGHLRDGFTAGKGLVVLNGQTDVDTLWLELPMVNETPLRVSGAISMRGAWIECLYTPRNNVVAVFENCRSVNIDRISLIEDTRRLQFIKCPDVQIGTINISGRNVSLDRAVSIDATSKLNIGMVYAALDTGMLDDPRISIRGAYNRQAKTYIDTRRALDGTNLLADPQFTTLASGYPSLAWQVLWGDSLGAVVGRYSVEQTANGPRLRIDIISNPNNRSVNIIGHVRVPVGTGATFTAPGTAHWRLEGPTQAQIWSGALVQYASRAMGSLTAVVTPGQLSSSDRVIFELTTAKGTYYLSNVGVVYNGVLPTPTQFPEIPPGDPKPLG
ncbi:MAG: hypothetical protein ACREJC_00105, partial [Tepidisphaeraceae bacterium]